MRLPFPIIFLTLVVFALVFFGSCRKNEIQKVNSISSAEVLPSESSTNVEIIFTDSAKVIIRLIAGKLDRYDGENPYMEFPQGLKLVFYNNDNQPESQIECNYAINHLNEKIMEAKNNVVVINKDGEKLNTEHLIWDQGKHLIHTEQFVKITTKEEILRGYGMEASEDFSKYTIKKLTGTILLDEDQLGTDDAE